MSSIVATRSLLERAQSLLRRQQDQVTWAREWLGRFVEAAVPSQDPAYVTVEKALGIAKELRETAAHRGNLLDELLAIFWEPGIGTIAHEDLVDAVTNLKQREKTYFNQRNAARLELQLRPKLHSNADREKLERTKNVNETLKQKVEQLEREANVARDMCAVIDGHRQAVAGTPNVGACSDVVVFLTSELADLRHLGEKAQMLSHDNQRLRKALGNKRPPKFPVGTLVRVKKTGAATKVNSILTYEDGSHLYLVDGGKPTGYNEHKLEARDA